MKYSVVVCMVMMFAFGCIRDEKITKLLEEQKILKDSANHLNESIGHYLHKGNNDSAETQKKQLGAVHARLKRIQTSIDRLEK